MPFIVQASQLALLIENKPTLGLNSIPEETTYTLYR